MRLSRSRVMSMLMRAVVEVVALQGIANLLVPLRQWFPSEFLRSGGEPTEPGMVAVHAGHIYPAPQPVTLPKRYRVVREASHPWSSFRISTKGTRRLSERASLNRYPNATDRSSRLRARCEINSALPRLRGPRP